MNKFNIGDKVIVNNSKSSRWNLTASVRSYRINNITNGYRYDVRFDQSNGFVTFYEKDLVLSTSTSQTQTAAANTTTPMQTQATQKPSHTPYKVGDKVIYHGLITSYRGQVFEVTRICSNPDFYETAHINGGGLIVKYDEIAPTLSATQQNLASPTQTTTPHYTPMPSAHNTKFQVGDRVTVKDPGFFANGRSGTVGVLNSSYLLPMPTYLVVMDDGNAYSLYENQLVAEQKQTTQVTITPSGSSQTVTLPTNGQAYLAVDPRLKQFEPTLSVSVKVPTCTCSMRDLTMNGCPSARGLPCTTQARSK